MTLFWKRLRPSKRRQQQREPQHGAETVTVDFALPPRPYNSGPSNDTEFVEQTQAFMERWSRSSEFVERNPPPMLPEFDPKDVDIERKPLGEGEFGVVFVVSALHVTPDQRGADPEAATVRQQSRTILQPQDDVKPSEDTILSSLASAPLNRWRVDSCDAKAGPSPDDGNFTLRIPAIAVKSGVSSHSLVTRNRASTEGDALSVATHHTANAASSICRGDSTVMTQKTKKHSSSSLSKKSTRSRLQPKPLHTHSEEPKAAPGQQTHRVVLSNTSIVDLAGYADTESDMNSDNSTLSTTEDNPFLDDEDWLREEGAIEVENDFFDDMDGEAEFLRSRMSQNITRNGQGRYAVKRLHSHGYTLSAAVDLACEARFLASLRHPNIVRLRGTIGTPGSSSFGLITDRLDVTLREKMRQWRDEELAYRKRRKWDHFRLDLLADKLLAVYDIARAMRYLHNQMIVFRDLKPENVAVDLRGQMRLFDFGLAKELRSCDLSHGTDDFNATGLTGSRRYMAPEVAMCRTYGLKSDVFSFAIFSWEVLATHDKRQPSTLAFPSMSLETHFDRVVVGGERPSLKRVQPKSLRPVLEQSWSAVPEQRPSFSAMCEELRQHVSLAGGAEAMDRTAYLSALSIKSMEE